MIAFIDEHGAVHGGEPICKVLPIAPSTYRAHAAGRNGDGVGSSNRTSDSFLRQRFAFGAGLVARTLQRVADRHAAGEIILVQRVEAMLGIAASTCDRRMTLAQEDYEPP